MIMFSTPFILSFALLLSLPLLFLPATRILPPHTTPTPISLDELDDLALFRRATLASTSPPSPSPTPKIAFLFLTNSDLTFSPLWELFFRGQNQNDLFNLYVHADPTARLRPPTGVFKGRFIAAKPTQRASPTLISAVRRLLATALLDDPANSYFALLSQHCIPLHSFSFIYNFLFPSESSNTTRRPTRRSFIEILSNDPGLRDRYIARGGDEVMLPEVAFSDFRVGSQFFVLTRQHAVLVIKDRWLWRKFRLPCRNATDPCYPEEHYFPTLLSMEDLNGCTGFTLTRVNWTWSTGGHPRTYRAAKVSPELVGRLRGSNSTFSYLFARKFAASCLQPLMAIADSVIFRD